MTEPVNPYPLFMDKHIVNQVSKKYMRKLCLDYPSVGSLISGDEWAEGIIERAIIEAFQQSAQRTASDMRALSTSTNYVVAKFGGGADTETRENE